MYVSDVYALTRKNARTVNWKTVKLLLIRYVGQEEKERESHFSKCTYLHSIDSQNHNVLHI